jgi:hypothetical protein
MRLIGISRASLSMGCSGNTRKRHARSEEFGCAVPDATFARADEYEDGWTVLAADACTPRGSIHRDDRDDSRASRASPTWSGSTACGRSSRARRRHTHVHLHPSRDGARRRTSRCRQTHFEREIGEHLRAQPSHRSMRSPRARPVRPRPLHRRSAILCPPATCRRPGGSSPAARGRPLPRRFAGPRLPFASCMDTGALHSLVRQLMTEPYSPPTTKAPFFIDRWNHDHTLRLFQSSSGMPLSGALRGRSGSPRLVEPRDLFGRQRAANAELATRLTGNIVK